jgi:SAM-dependent methyltransferase
VQPGSVDAVVMIEVLHEIGPALRPGVIRESAQALRPGGWLVIVDETYPSTLEETRRPEFAFPLMTGFEELLWGNVIPTREEQERLLRDAGLTGEIQRSLIGEGFTVLATRKP